MDRDRRKAKSEAEAAYDSDLVMRRFVCHVEVIVGVIFAGTIFGTGEGRSHDILRASADAPATEFVAARQTVDAIVIDSLHLGVGAATLCVQQNVLADREAAACANVRSRHALIEASSPRTSSPD